MAFVKRKWKDRLVEFVGRRKLTRVTGSIENQIIVDVTREEGTVSQAGDAFSEENMNDLENRIEEGFEDTVDKNNLLDEEATEANTTPGKYVSDAIVTKSLITRMGGLDFKLIDGVPYWSPRGADTWHPFMADETVYFKAGTTANFSDIIASLGKSNSDFTANNFRPVINSYSNSININIERNASKLQGWANANVSVSVSYSNGTCTISSKTNQKAYSQIALSTESINLTTSNIGVPSVIGIVFDPSDKPFTS